MKYQKLLKSSFFGQRNIWLTTFAGLHLDKERHQCQVLGHNYKTLYTIQQHTNRSSTINVGLDFPKKKWRNLQRSLGLRVF